MKKGILVIFICLISTLSFAETVNPPPGEVAESAVAGRTDDLVSKEGDEQIIAELLELNGIKAWLGSQPLKVDQMLQVLVESSMAKKADIEMIQEIRNKVYGPNQIDKYFYDSLKKYYDAKRFKKFVDFLQTPLGKKVGGRKKAMDQLSEDEQGTKYEIFAKDQPSEKRYALVSGMMYVSNWLKLELAAIGYSRIPMLLAMEPSITEQTLKEDIAILVDEFGSGAQGAMEVLFPLEGFLCHDFSDQELEDYIQHMLDPDIEYVQEAIYQSVVETFAKMRKDFLLRTNLNSDSTAKSDSNTRYGALSPEKTLDYKVKQVMDLTQQAEEYRYQGNLESVQQVSQAAIVLMEQLVFLEPNSSGLCVSLGITYQMVNFRLGRAAILLERAIQLNTPIWQAYSTLGLINLEWNKLERAEELFKKTLEMNPEAPGPDYNLGNIYRQKGQLDRAVEHLERAVKIDSKDAGSYGMLGLITAQQGKIEIAKKYLNEAKRLGLESTLVEQVEEMISKHKN